MLCFPFLYTTLKSKSCSRIVHLVSLEDSLGVMKAHTRAAWSVTTSNCYPSSMARHFSAAHATARHSFSKTAVDLARIQQSQGICNSMLLDIQTNVDGICLGGCSLAAVGLVLLEGLSLGPQVSLGILESTSM